MKKYLFSITTVVIITFFTSCSLKNPSLAHHSDNLTIEILHINDTHSHLEPIKTSIYINGKKTYVYAGGYAKIAKYIKEKKTNPHIIVLHAGDAVQGSLYYILFKGKADVEALNKMKLDAMTVGNHEFDKNATSFGINFAKLANFPIISCDINASANPILKNIIKPYIIKEIDKQKIAIVGDSVNSSVISNPGPTVVFSNYIDSAKKYVNELKKRGINKIIFLTHIGYKHDQFLARQIPDIDIIIGGHSHTLLGDFTNIGMKSKGPYPTVINHNLSKTLIVTDYKWGEMIGDINVTFDKNGKITNYTGTPVMLVSDIFLRKNANGKKVEVNESIKTKIKNFISNQPNIKIESNDKTVEQIINKYKPEVNKLMKTVIGIAAENLVNVRLPNKKNPHGSMIAPIVAKALYEKAEKTGGCDFALQNVGAVRISIPKGNISIGEVYTLLPFGNTLVILNLKGAKIKTMLENVIDLSFIKHSHTGSFPYMYNAKITINVSNKKGQRITSFKIKDANGNWIDLDQNKTYKIATNSYIANGGDYYSEMRNASNKTDTGFLNTEIFINYIKSKGTIKKLPDDEVPITLQ